MVACVEEYGNKTKTQKRACKTCMRLKKATLEIFSEKPVNSVIGRQVSICLAPSIDPMKIRHLACAAVGFVFGYFSSAMIGVTSNEIETSLKPLKRPFVRRLRAFLER